LRSKQQHIISKVFVEVDSNTSAEAHDMRLNSERLFNDSVISVVDDYIAEIEPQLKDWTVQLDRLDLNFSMTSGMLSEIEVREAIRKQLDTVFKPILEQVKSNKVQPNKAVSIVPNSKESTQNPQEKAVMLNPEMRHLKSVLYFLETGKAPWWIRSHEEMRGFLSAKGLQKLIASKKTELVRSLQKLFRQGKARKRFARQFKDESLFLFIGLIQEALDQNDRLTSALLSSRNFKRQFKNLSPSQRMTAIDAILLVFSKEDHSVSDVNIWEKSLAASDEAASLKDFLNSTAKELAQELSSEKTEPQTTKENQEFEESTDPDKAYEGVIAENAGLVLLNPFLKQFFSVLNLLEEDGSLNDPIQAAHLLHFLATGEENDFEFTLIFEAFLCELPLDEPLPRDVTLSEKQKEACHELLMAVLNHWTALKSQSIPLLRKEFLQRKGKLMLNETTPRIVVERGAIDILMDKLPWSISMLKLPWRNEFIYVEW